MCMKSSSRHTVVLIFLFIAFSCTSTKKESEEVPLFTLLPPSQTGINFTNTVTDSKEMSILNYHNFYNGGGVAIGDINGDGKPDIFFTSNQGENKLYLNKGIKKRIPGISAIVKNSLLRKLLSRFSHNL